MIDAAVAQAKAASDRAVIALGHSLGGQLVAGHAAGNATTKADAIVTVAAAIPHHATFPLRQRPALLMMGGVVVPTLTRLFGYLPPPAFGGPGARTLMHEWGQLVTHRQIPFPVNGPIATPALIISVDDDALAPSVSVDHFAKDMFNPASVTRLKHTPSSYATRPNSHIGWIRHPELIVADITLWWSARSELDRRSAKNN